MTTQVNQQQTYARLQLAKSYELANTTPLSTLASASFKLSPADNDHCDSHNELMRRFKSLGPAIRFTIFKNNKGLATKKFGMANGKLTKSAHIQVWSGEARVVTVYDVNGLCRELHELGTNECILWGVPKVAGNQFEVTTRANRKGKQIARTREYFKFLEDEPGLLMLDFDAPDGKDFDDSAPINALFDAVPALQEFAFAGNLSCSANIYLDENKLRGIGGFRMYFMVSAASDIPAIGELIAQRLWLAGHGYIKVGNAGQMLERTLVDTSVWQPERCDFAARGVYEDGLTSMAAPASAQTHGKKGQKLKSILALRDLKPLTSVESQTYRTQVADAKTTQAMNVATAKNRWVEKRAKTLADNKQVTVPQAQALLMGVLEGACLPPEFELTSQEGQTVSVAELLNDRKRWNKVRFLDPIDPDHRGGNDHCAVAYLDGIQPVIWSLAHGKRRYVLQTTRPQLKLSAGGRISELEFVQDALLKSGVIVRNQASELAMVIEGTLKTFRPDGKALKLECMRIIETVRTIKGIQEITDFPIGHAQDVLSDFSENKFPKVAAVIDYPLIRLDGSIISETGLDKKTGLYIVETSKSGLVQIPESSDEQAAVEAAERLLKPLAAFPFVAPHHKGVALAGILTAVTRPILEEAPGFIFNAPLPGTGKTYLAQYLCVIRTGEIPHPKGPDSLRDTEIAKEIVTWVRESLPLVLVDNWKEGTPLGNPDLDMLMTSGRVSKRKLGVNESIEGHLRALFMITGNNVALHCDTARRVLMCKMDAQMEKPKDRVFEGDPLKHALSNRCQIISDVLTIIQAWFGAGQPKHYPAGKGKLATYSNWDDMVRQPICWLKSLGVQGIDDPVLSQIDAEDVDVGRNNAGELIHAIQALQMLQETHFKEGKTAPLAGWWESRDLINLAGDAKTREANILRGSSDIDPSKFRSENAEALAVADALACVLGGAIANDGSKARSLGAWLASRKDAPFDGQVLRMHKSGKKSARFQVVVHTPI